MKVIGFVRVSTGHQRLSVSNQIAEITDYCKKTDDLELIEILQEENLILLLTQVVIVEKYYD